MGIRRKISRMNGVSSKLPQMMMMKMKVKMINPEIRVKESRLKREFRQI